MKLTREEKERIRTGSQCSQGGNLIKEFTLWRRNSALGCHKISQPLNRLPPAAAEEAKELPLLLLLLSAYEEPHSPSSPSLFKDHNLISARLNYFIQI